MGNGISDSSEILVRRAGRQEAALVAAILVDAFSSDPVSRWISSKPEFLSWGWPLIVPFLLPHDEIYIAGNGLGAALWMPPGAKLDIRLGPGVLWTCWCRFGLRSILRFFRLIIAMEKHHPKDPHYYLFAVGVRDEVKGRGIGSALLEPVLTECDRRRVVAYLENSNPSNLSFYGRHGFEVRNEITVSRNGPKIWLMFRDPQKQ